jgi:hypothetical protein
MTLITIDMELRGAEALRQRDVNDALRRALEGMCLRWRRQYLPKHFTKGGAREYGYQPRQGERNPLKRGSYSNRKLRLFSHVLPNVYTGELRRLSLQGPQTVRATVTRTRARVRAVLPRKANFRLHELKIVSSRERAALEQFLVQRIEFELNRRGAAATAVISIRA